MPTETPRTDHAPTPLPSVMVVVFLVSMGTGVFWNAISFVAKHAYDFPQERTLVLYFVMGVIYTLGAWRSGPVVRWARRRVTPRSIIAVTIVVQAVLCVGPIVFAAETWLWIAVVGVTYSSSLLWPLMESYVTAGRHGPAMRSAVAWFNFTWMTAVAVPLLLMPPILEHHAVYAVGALTVANVVALFALPRFKPAPGHHDVEMADANVPAEYGLLLQCARVLLPMSYVVNAALAPILPYRFDAIDAPIEIRTPVTATWMIVRVVALLIMWRVGFWHGRWGTLLLAGVTMAGGFGLVVLAPSLWTLAVGLAFFGIGIGIAYHAALYYAMAVGRAEVEAGSTHEALIGSGYTVGPAAGLLGTWLGGGAAIVGAVWSVVAVASIGAFWPYVVARRRRSRTKIR